MYEVYNTNGAYYHCLAFDICVDLSCFPSTLLSNEYSLASLPPLLILQQLRYWASHIPVHHHVESCLLSHNHHYEDSDSPFRIFHSRSPERYVPSGQHLLLPARVSPMTCIILTYPPPTPRFLLRRVSQDAIHPSLINQILDLMLRECHYA